MSQHVDLEGGGGNSLIVELNSDLEHLPESYVEEGVARLSVGIGGGVSGLEVAGGEGPEAAPLKGAVGVNIGTNRIGAGEKISLVGDGGSGGSIDNEGVVGPPSGSEGVVYSGIGI